jgi:hypothetical protein
MRICYSAQNEVENYPTNNMEGKETKRNSESEREKPNRRRV